MLQFLTRVFGSRNERLVRGYGRYVHAANELEPTIQALSDEGLRAKTDEFRRRLKEGTKLDDLLPEAFAVVREAARRTLKMRHFDVQLIGGISLHEGKIAEISMYAEDFEMTQHDLLLARARQRAATELRAAR